MGVMALDIEGDDDGDFRELPTGRATREDLVQSDAGPAHVHRGRSQSAGTGKDVLLSEFQVSGPKFFGFHSQKEPEKVDPLTESNPWIERGTPAKNTRCAAAGRARRPPAVGADAHPA